MGDHDELTVRALLDAWPETWAQQAGIRLADTPSALYRLLVLSTLLSARISGEIAVAAARELSRAGFRTPRRMADAAWQERVDALGRGHYRRYDERTATMLGDGARLLLDEYRGDLRRLRANAEDTDQLRTLLQQFPGIGQSGADIFCREVQGTWTEIAPFVDARALEGAHRLGLPPDAAALARLVPTAELPRLVGALERAARHDAFVSRIGLRHDD
jgi:endonuclease III